MSDYDDDKMELPHAFNVKRRVLQDTKILNADGKPIYRAPEPIGYVKPSHHQRYVVKDEG